jgi:hypothetical protein
MGDVVGRWEGGVGGREIEFVEGQFKEEDGVGAGEGKALEGSDLAGGVGGEQVLVEFGEAGFAFDDAAGWVGGETVVTGG